MKKLSYTVLIILFSSSLFIEAQNLKPYLKEKGYVQLTDTANLPKIMMPYYKTIMDTINYKYPEMKSFYVRLKSIQEDKDYFSAIFYPLDGIILIKKTDEKERKENEEEQLKEARDTSKNKQRIQIIDNFGGSVGELILRLNKATHRMLFYQTQ